VSSRSDGLVRLVVLYLLLPMVYAALFVWIWNGDLVPLFKLPGISYWQAVRVSALVVLTARLVAAGWCGAK
jgi:hypothetical protein